MKKINWFIIDKDMSKFWNYSMSMIIFLMILFIVWGILFLNCGICNISK